MSAEGSSSAGEITITVKGPQELKLSITIAPSKTISELKEKIATESHVDKERQRLIFSGKVLKDDETISSYKIATGHTLHMVKGADKSASAAPAAAAPLPSMGTGLNVAGNPADNIENIHHGLGGFNPFNGMGVNNLGDPNAMAEMMQSPAFLQQMSDMMSRPEVLEQIISSNPQLAGMGPQIRQMMQNPMVRQMMSNPDTLRMMMQMQAQMDNGGSGGGFNPFGAAPGGAGAAAVPPAAGDDTNLFAAAQNARAGGGAPPAGAGAGAGANPFASLMGGAGAGGANPYAGLFGNAGGAGGAAGANPFASLMGGAGAGGANPFTGLFGAPPHAAAPQDTRPPEEIYATQLGQLNGMGLWDAAKNIRALRMAGGNVEAAVDLLFSGQLD